MPVLTYKAQDFTGRECWVFDGKEWQHAVVTGPETVTRTPFFMMSGYAESPLTPVLLDDGRQNEVGTLWMKWHKPPIRMGQ